MKWKILLNTIAFVLGCLAYHAFSKKTESSELSFQFHEADKTIPISDPHREDAKAYSSKVESKKAQNTDHFKSAQEARRTRSISSREQWDEKKHQYSDYTLYFMDRHPREVAEELINAYR
jgi:hypothetical protein